MVIGFSSMGCVTKSLWRNGTVSNTYNEQIIAFYMSPKVDKIAFLGNKYHYIFDKNTATFIDLLKHKEFLNLRQSNLEVGASVMLDKDNQMRTDIHVEFAKATLNPEQLSYLLNHGFRTYSIPPRIVAKGESVPVRSEEAIYMNNYTLEGKRYLANGQVNQQASKLTQPMPLTIRTFKKEGDVTLYKVVMTPLSVTADAGLILAGAVLFPFMWLAK
jgi:hypothetical protein